jgi:hypothetical protein
MEADTPRKAALLAADIQKEPFFEPYFTVELPDGDWCDVDLSRLPREQELTIYQGESDGTS